MPGYGKMPQEVTLPWHSDMQLASKLVLSAAALLLLTLAYRFYKSRSLAGGKIPPGEVGEERESASRDGDGVVGVRRRRGFGEEVRRGGGHGEVSGQGNGCETWCRTPCGDRRLPRGKEEEGDMEEKGEETVSELGLRDGGVGVARRGSGLRNEQGSDLGSQLGREMGSKLGSQPGTDLEFGLGSELGIKSGGEVESTLRSKPESELASKGGNKLGSELESKLASKPRKKSGSKPGIDLGSKEGSELGRELGSKLGSELGSERGSELGSELGKEPGINLKNYLRSELGSKPGSGLGKESRSKLGSELASKPGSDPGNEPGKKLGRELGRKPGSKLGSHPGRKPSSHDSGGTAKSPSISGQEVSLSPSSELLPGIGDAQMGGDGCTQSMGQDLAIGGMSQEAKGCKELIQTLSITSGLGLTMTASDAGSDASYSFSSVAKIQVEENYITERRVRAGAGQPVPGLRGKVYDYYVQSISQSVLKKRSSLYIPRETSQRCSLERVNEELKDRSTTQEPDPAPSTQESDPTPSTREPDPTPATQEPDPTPATQEPDPTPSIQESDPASPLEDFTISSKAPPPAGSLETSSEPPSPGRKVSILRIADSPHLQLPMEGFGATTAAASTTPPASPQAGLGRDADFFRPPGAARLDLENCYEVLCAAKAQHLGALQEAAYQVMSDNYLQVLRTPSIYGRLNAGERELILRRRMKGKRCVAVADVSPPEPGPRASRLCYYDEAGDSWHHLCHLPPEVVSRGCAVCSMFNYLFVVAGCEGTGRTQRPSNRVFCYDPLTDLWREICPLNQARPRCKLVALDGYLYAIGGECLCTVERYDPRRDRWSFAAPLPRDTFAVAHAAAACHGEIYVTGGTLRSLLLRYAARTDSWSLGPASSAGKERTVEMVSTDGFLYRFDLQPGTGIGVYRCSAKAKLWYQCATYPLPNAAGFHCAALGGLVHCVGRHFHLRFLADHVSPRFGAKELQPFPAPRGSLLPAVLVLPEGGRAQTEV